MIDTNVYDCPISEQIDHLKMMMADEHDRTIIKAVQQIGIEIDQESLIQAINSDRKRYEEAYKKGYADCEEHYKELILQIVGKVGETNDAVQKIYTTNALLSGSQLRTFNRAGRKRREVVSGRRT